MAKKKKFPWQDKICNKAQLGGIETCLLDNGPGKGVRIAWVNTGNLRYKVVLDKCADIAEAFHNEHGLAWISPAGIRTPRPDSAHDFEWLYSFAGGLLSTCGLAHHGPPEEDENGERGLHGRISNIPASVESIIQPDPIAGKLDMSITAVTRQSRLFGENLEIRRTISGRIGKATIKIRDVVTNRGPLPQPHMILYHCNFGWPLVDEGTDIIWKGRCKSRGMEQDDQLFKSKHDYKKCQKPLEIHKGGEACGFVNIKPDKKGICTIGLNNKKFGLALMMKYPKKNLPWMCNWQHWGFGDYVCALEPGTNPPIGQIAARKQKKLITLAPGESKTYDLEISVLTEQRVIDRFLQTAGS
ncbi:aldose 1-epimerase family protein [Planctomycetota bacterium]